MNSAMSCPMFSMWCSEPESMWNMSPALMVNDENLFPVSSTDTSEVPETQ
jgi:hypothetical protein